MKTRMTAFSTVVLAALIGVSIWATAQVGIGDAIRVLVDTPAAGTHPWFIATLFDAYFGFLWFWLWVAYKESGWTPRIVWLLLILALGNIAIAIYVLLQLRRLPAGAGAEGLLLRRT